jgi:hypothetical protein
MSRLRKSFVRRFFLNNSVRTIHGDYIPTGVGMLGIDIQSLGARVGEKYASADP